MTDAPLLCHRCAAELTPGKGDFYVVRIEAVADPFPPVIEADELGGSLAERIGQLVDQMRELSDQELMDQVYRRMTICLCGSCYRVWIEDPVGGGAGAT